jgi:hypothetical protein
MLTKQGCIRNQDKIASYVRDGYEAPAISYQNCVDCPTGKRIAAGNYPRKIEAIPLTPIAKKKCRGCGLEKPITEYHQNKLTKDGLQNICRACVSEKYYPAYKDRRKSKTGVSR